MQKLAVIILQELIKIRKIQKKSHFTMADKMGTQAKQIWRLEQLKIEPRINSLERYAAALGYTIKFNLEQNERV